MKVGRPPKYSDEETRRISRVIQNRENQRKCRLRKREHDKIVKYTNHSQNQEDRYKNELVNHFKQFDFNYFFTGTCDPNYRKKREIKLYNDEICTLNQLLETDLSYYKEKRIGIKSLRKYTEKFIQLLSDKGLINKYFVVFEMGKNKRYHVHILFGTNPYTWGLVNYSETRWLLGTSISVPIKDNQNKLNLLSYCTKEMKPLSKKVLDINKMENWFFGGDFNLNRKSVLRSKETSLPPNYPLYSLV